MTRMHVATFTSLFPNSLHPLLAVFVRTRMEAYARRHGADWSVVAPVPWFPKLPFPVNARYDRLARVPLKEACPYPVYHPRYLVTPGFGMGRYAGWMAAGARATLNRIHAERRIDLIDAHYLYPDGAAAVLLGAELGIPVVLSARGTDLNVFPSIPAVRPLILKALEGSRALICVSGDLKAKAMALGVPDGKAFVIGNGVDTARFFPGDRGAARAKLGLPAEARIIFSVGNLVEGKGFSVLMEAFAALRHPEPHLFIAGQGPLREALLAQAVRLGISDRVRLLGGVANADLPDWYRATDAFALATAREGWPNVVSEAQACGTPVVATRVSGIPEIVSDASLGNLVDERTPEAFRAALADALAKPWDRSHIAATGGKRTWDAVADDVAEVFRRVLGHPPGARA